jgi:hypothetical protein
MIESFSKYFYSLKGSIYLSTLRKRRVKYHKGKKRIRNNSSPCFRREAIFRNIVYSNKSSNKLPRRRKRFISNKLKILTLNTKLSIACVDYARCRVVRRHRRSLYYNQYKSKYNSRNAYIALFSNSLLRRRSIKYRNLWKRRRKLFKSFLGMLRHYGGKRWLTQAESFKEMLFLFKSFKAIRIFSDTQCESNRRNFDYCLFNYSYIYNLRRLRTIMLGRAKRRRRLFIKFLKSNFVYHYRTEQDKNLFNPNYERQIEYRDVYKESDGSEEQCIHNNGIYYYNLYYREFNDLKDRRHVLNYD